MIVKVDTYKIQDILIENMSNVQNEQGVNYELVEKIVGEIVEISSVETSKTLGYCVECNAPLNKNNGYQVEEEYVFCEEHVPEDLKISTQQQKQQAQPLPDQKSNYRIDFKVENEAEKKIYLMIDRQFSLNILSTKNPNWITDDDTDWDCALIDETSEALTSCAYKWWKHQDMDISNIILEIIDLLHFGLSKFMTSKVINVNEELRDSIIEGFTRFEKSTIPDGDFNNMLELNEPLFKKFIIDRIKNMLKVIFLYKNDEEDRIKYETLFFQFMFESLFALGLFKDVEISQNDCITVLFTNYMVKNLLNKFRQENGYKDGTYIKEWEPNKEDNEVLFNYINTLVIEDTFIPTIENFMKEHYKKLIKLEKLK